MLLDFLNIGSKLIDKLIPDPAAKAQAQLELLKLQQSGELEEMKAQLSAIIAEAQSPDPWTSRARPSFLYCMILMIVTAIPFSILWAFNPAAGLRMSEGLQHWLGAIPSDLWMLFGAGYLGYTGMRTIEKRSGAAK